MMQKAILVAVVFVLAVSCVRGPDPPVVKRSDVSIGTVQRGNMRLPAAASEQELKDVVYISRPALGLPNMLYKLDPDGQSATPVAVQYGKGGAGVVEILSGLQPGDQIILTDMAAYEASGRVALR